MEAEDAFQNLIDDLCKIYQSYQKEKFQYEQLCRDCQSLFLEWPKKRSTDNCIVAKEASTAFTTHNNGNCNQGRVSPGALAELTLVEKTLAKAGKLMEKYEKRNTQHETSQEGHSELSAKGSDGVSETKPTESPECRKAAGKPSAQKGCKNNATIRFTAPRTKPNGCKGPSHTSISASTISLKKRNDLIGDRPTKVDSYTKGTVRPVSTRYSPAHVRAPYKTEVVAKRAVQTKADRQRRSAGLRELPCIQRGSSADRKAPSVAKGKDTESRVPLQCANQLQAKYSTHEKSSVFDSSTSESRRNEVNECDYIDTRLPKGTLDDKSGCEVPSVQTDCKDMSSTQQGHQGQGSRVPEPGFLLATEGTTLKLPGSYRKSYTQNHRLRTNVLRIAQRADPSNVARLFVDRLEMQAPEDEHCQWWLRKVVSLTDVYSCLRELLDEVQPAHLNGNQSWQHVVRLKTKLEFVFSTFADLENQFYTITKGTSASDWPSVLSREKMDRLHRAPCPDTGGLSPDPRDTGGLSPDPRDTGPEGARWPLVYSRKAHVREVHKLRHRVKVLQLERRVLSGLSESLDWLQRTDPSDRSYKAVYRAMYSMTTSIGRTFPVLVTDTIDDGQT